MAPATGGSSGSGRASGSTRKKPETDPYARLEDLERPADGSKPPYAWWIFIRAAINSSPQQSLGLQGVYDLLMAHFPCFKDSDEQWKNAIRHNLSIKPCFVKTKGGQGQGNVWHMDYTVDASKGRIRNRKAGKVPKRSVAQRVAENNVLSAKRFHEELLQMPLEEGVAPHLTQGFALTFDRNVANSVMNAIEELLREPRYAKAGQAEAEALNSIGTWAVMADALQVEEDPNDAPIPLEELKMDPSIPPLVHNAANQIRGMLDETQALVPLPAGFGNKAMQTAVLEKPEEPMAVTIRNIILRSPERQLTVYQVLEGLQEAHAYYRNNLSDNWKSSARVTLTTYECFAKDAQPGRADIWYVLEDKPIEARPPRVGSGPLKLRPTIIRAADVHATLSAIAARQQQTFVKLEED